MEKEKLKLKESEVNAIISEWKLNLKLKKELGINLTFNEFMEDLFITEYRYKYCKEIFEHQMNLLIRRYLAGKNVYSG